MITGIEHFFDALDNFNHELFAHTDTIEYLNRQFVHDFSEEGINKEYESLYMVLPFQIEVASDKIALANLPFEAMELKYASRDYDSTNNPIDIDVIKNIKIRRTPNFDLEYYRYSIYEILHEYMHNLVYFYDKVLANTKAYSFFTNIEDEKIILSNLLNRYKMVRLDNTKQISIIWGITLTKKLADLVLDILIDFVEQRLKLITIDYRMEDVQAKNTYVDNSVFQIKWLGTQQELCELLVELIDKGWLEKINDGDRSKFCKSITTIFDLESTQIRKDSNVNTSFYQQFKGENIKGERVYSFMDSPKYDRKFKLIKKKE